MQQRKLLSWKMNHSIAHKIYGNPAVGVTLISDTISSFVFGVQRMERVSHFKTNITIKR
jgi:hypothetical protein